MTNRNFIIACSRPQCGWNFTQDYIRMNPDSNDIRPMYGDVCECGGVIKRFDFEPTQPKKKGIFAKIVALLK